MKLYRFALKKYSDDVSGTGAKLFGGRWNSKGHAALYTSESISLAVLEVLAHHVQYADLNEQYLITLDVPESASITIINPVKLKANWKDEVAYTRFIGDEFIKDNKNLLLRLPSSIIPEEFNVLINPLHQDFKKIRIVSNTAFHFDDRLLRYN